MMWGFFFPLRADYLKFAHVNLRVCAMAWAVVGRFCACPFVCVCVIAARQLVADVYQLHASSV